MVLLPIRLKVDKMSRNYSKAIPFIFFTAILSVFPYCAFASVQPATPSISLISNATSYEVDENISVSLVLNTGDNSINAMQGTIQIPGNSFDASDITTGSSFLTLWPEAPALSHNGEGNGGGRITFTGGVPNGFTGHNGVILNLSLKAKKSGEVTIILKDFMVLLNDGMATELSGIKLAPLVLHILPDKK